MMTLSLLVLPLLPVTRTKRKKLRGSIHNTSQRLISLLRGSPFSQNPSHHFRNPLSLKKPSPSLRTSRPLPLTPPNKGTKNGHKYES